MIINDNQWIINGYCKKKRTTAILFESVGTGGEKNVVSAFGDIVYPICLTVFVNSFF